MILMGKSTVNVYGKWPLTVDLAMNYGDFPYSYLSLSESNDCGVRFINDDGSDDCGGDDDGGGGGGGDCT